MYTEQLTQGLCLQTPVQPQQLTTTTTVTTGPIDMQECRRAIFVFDMGAFGGTSPTCSAVLTVQESSASGSGFAANATIPTTTITAASTGMSAEIRAGQLAAGKRYVRASIVCTIGGTSPTIPVAALAIGSEADHKPAALFNDLTTYPVANQTVVN